MSRDIFNRDKGVYGKLMLKPKAGKHDDTYTPEPVKIVSKKEEAPKTFTFRLNKKLSHDPGQFLQCSVLGCGEAPISFGGWNPNHVEINVKEVGRVSKEICALKKGNTLHVRGPYGHGYPMQHMTGNDIIIVAAGTGVAPVRGVIQYVEHHRKDFGQLHLFFGFRDPESILFKDDMLRWKKTFNMCVSISRAPDGYVGKTGHCTDALEEAKLTNEKKIAIICGPAIMIGQAANILKMKGFHEDQIYVSHERHMKCATGVCGHCMIKGQYCCRDGPVFRYDHIGNPKE